MADVLKLPPFRGNSVEDLNRLVVELNKQLNRIAQRLDDRTRKLVLSGDLDFNNFRAKNVGTPKDESDAITIGRLEEHLDDLANLSPAIPTSEGDEGVGFGISARQARRTSRFRRAVEDEVDQKLLDAVPTVAPPEVESVGAVGTTADPPVFALSDHTHSGVNSPDTQTVTGLKTFDRDPAAPFEVTPGSDTVVNLGAERARRALLALPLDAGVAPLPDLGYRRTFLTMGA